MKILHLIHTMKPEAGGVVEAVRLLAAANHAAGLQDEVLCLDKPGTAAETYTFAVHEIGPAVGGYGYTDALIPWLKVNHENYDAVIVHGLWQYIGYSTRQVLRGTATPYYVFPHGMLDPWFKRAYPRKHLKKVAYWRLGEYRVLRDAKAVCFTCEAERRLARESFRPYDVNEAVVGLGVEEPPANLTEGCDGFSLVYPKIGYDYLLFLGRLDPKKGIDLLVKAYRELHEAGRELPPLVLAGPGEKDAYADELRTLAGETPGIHFTGMLKGKLKWGALAGCGAMILPSHQENFGIVVAEALALGKPVLISDKVNIFEEIQTDGAGIIESDTLEGTRQLITRWLDQSEHEREMMTSVARPCYVKRFGIAQVATRLRRLLSPEHEDA